jgi:hypothetical protein
MRGARSKPLLLGALAVLASACGVTSQEGPPRLQANLRALASGAPAGDRACWLGPEFRGAPVRFADAAWGRYAILTYGRPQDVVVDVESFRAHAPGGGTGSAVRVRTASGQDVLLVFRFPRRPSLALRRAAKAALQAIPAHVVYPG